jgi:hypothetical protein
MAVVQNPVIGRSKQKFANVVLSTWYGRNVMRSKALQVRNPRSPKQVVQRVNFTIVTTMLALFIAQLVPLVRRKIFTLPFYNELSKYLLQYLPYSADNTTGDVTPGSGTTVLVNSGNLTPVSLTAVLGTGGAPSTFTMRFPVESAPSDGEYRLVIVSGDYDNTAEVTDFKFKSYSGSLDSIVDGNQAVEFEVPIADLSGGTAFVAYGFGNPTFGSTVKNLDIIVTQAVLS